MVPSGSSDVSSTDTESTQLLDTVPSSPPPPYEHVLAESTLAAQRGEDEEGLLDEACGADNSYNQDRHGEETEGEQQDRNRQEQQKSNPPKEILIIHKSTKSLYKALAAQWGITCKMSDQCPCLDCQSHYFDCEYDRDNENEKTDGGLGAGTPMFISEVMHGTACSIL
ncbi:Hypothetical protein NTJ_08240 [Nesidiocoris tenuis]|uniref:DUF4802 domain-containing protein n=1 Tax=Nesidiocoris tenuis TaxID=355587 RepID=A0ABN7AX32_9HEMI|nr:Hypothetical protein NTJ_08240 [Nesidiocoris tenuis]